MPNNKTFAAFSHESQEIHNEDEKTALILGEVVVGLSVRYWRLGVSSPSNVRLRTAK